MISAVAAWSEYAAGYMAVECAAAPVQRKENDAEGALKVSIIKGDEAAVPRHFLNWFWFFWFR